MCSSDLISYSSHSPLQILQNNYEQLFLSIHTMPLVLLKCQTIKGNKIIFGKSNEPNANTRSKADEQAWFRLLNCDCRRNKLISREKPIQIFEQIQTIPVQTAQLWFLLLQILVQGARCHERLINSLVSRK